MNITEAIKEFLIPGQKNNNEDNYHKYPKEYDGLEVRVSFGNGNKAKVKWFGFFGEGHTPQNGYYPTFLFYEDENKLMLVYGISSTKKLDIEDVWDENIRKTKKQIKDYKLQHSKKNDYSKSYVHHYYDPKKVNGKYVFYRDNILISDEQLLSELNEVISYYKKCLDSDKRPFWFVGALINNEDFSEKFIADGFWEHGNESKYFEEVKSMKVGDAIAIKATYTRKNNLPFENFGNITSVMSFKAKGIITENPGDGRKVYVDWNKLDNSKEWYFYTHIPTVWKVNKGEWKNDALINFAFNNEEQDIERFLNDPYWKSKYLLEDTKNIDIKEYEPYQLENIIDEGAFIEIEKLEKIMRRLKEKKKLILQAPPGTGKTWLATRIGKALIGKDVDVPQIRSVQFHPNLSYEDFVRGWRPGSDEKLSLKEGTFMEMVSEAKNNPEEKYVLIIEEINRGNPAQIFGELLTLIESSKRNKKDSIQLCYPDSDGKYVEVFVPDNLYILGTMNLADRSLALVDMAFRRRFAFFDLEPTLNSAWKKYVVNEMNMDRSIAENIQLSIGNLNNEISNDSRLGKQFQIGHSFFTPTESIKNKDSKSWFNEVVESEIKPLLEEHWFDAPEEVEKSIKKLITD